MAIDAPSPVSSVSSIPDVLSTEIAWDKARTRSSFVDGEPPPQTRSVRGVLRAIGAMGSGHLQRDSLRHSQRDM